MQIEEAFTTEAIEVAGTNVTEEEEERLGQLIRTYVLGLENIGDTEEERLLNVAALAFVGGRTYQAANTKIPIWMSPELVSQFLEFTTSQKE